MIVEDATLEKIAHLARIHLPENAKPAMKKDMEQILTWMEKLKEVEITGVEPLIHMSQEVNILRPDTPVNPSTGNQRLEGSIHTDETFFLVPKVIGG